MRRECHDGFNAAPPMRFANHALRGKSVLLRPAPPNACDSTSGVDQHAIEIEKNCATPEEHIRGYQYELTVKLC